ncbi:MAG TPA: hypothetical protein VEW42_06630, partial [Candidatus Eisenbacteria bacterium]|nr:hypothetical protein [Candidatus Eisenbacteria bacterium]
APTDHNALEVLAGDKPDLFEGLPQATLGQPNTAEDIRRPIKKGEPDDYHAGTALFYNTTGHNRDENLAPERWQAFENAWDNLGFQADFKKWNQFFFQGMAYRRVDADTIQFLFNGNYAGPQPDIGIDNVRAGLGGSRGNILKLFIAANPELLHDELFDALDIAMQRDRKFSMHVADITIDGSTATVAMVDAFHREKDGTYTPNQLLLAEQFRKAGIIAVDAEGNIVGQQDQKSNTSVNT